MISGAAVSPWCWRRRVEPTTSVNSTVTVVVSVMARVYPEPSAARAWLSSRPIRWDDSQIVDGSDWLDNDVQKDWSVPEAVCRLMWQPSLFQSGTPIIKQNRHAEAASQCLLLGDDRTWLGPDTSPLMTHLGSRQPQRYCTGYQPRRLPAVEVPRLQ